MSIPKSKRVAVLCLCAVILPLIFARSYSVHANPDATDEAMNTIRPEAIRADMRFLSDDALEGRGTGSRGYDIAAKFMATQFESLGLQPAGDKGSYFQAVPLRLAKPDETKTTLVLERSGKDETLIFRKDYISRGNPVLPESSAEAPVVFVGDGVTAPDQRYDDYQGVDAKGKIVAFMFEAPNFESSLKAHYSSGEVKLQNAVAHGAVGVIVLDDPILERLYSFKEQVRDLSFPELRWLDKQQRPNDYFPELKGNAFLSLEATKKFFEGSPHSAEEVFAAIKAGKPMSFVMPLSAKIRNVTELRDVGSRNVAAKLEGSDSTLKNEYVVYSAHLDHLGIGEPVEGDAIYNGALDNASGSAILLEVARAFSRMKTHPRRSILFLSVTGEEAGLLGSDYFAHYPTVNKSSVVANVNMDEDLMLWPLRDIVAFGAEHSSLDAVVKKAAARMHLSESPDPNPEEVVFIRSDQYSFVKQGVPAIFPVPGFKSDDPKIKPADIFKNWEETRYHQPQDDMDQPGLDFDAAAKYARFVFLCGFLITEDSQRPTWNKGDFFGEHYAHPVN
ncbi:MAG TPA: M28 family peptidase [Candidatus Acidoferrum sp.]|nr:M28 family peptidase [Candidatus Acidoferrum sp.]